MACWMWRTGWAGRTIPAIRGQFLKEAQVGGRLLHPNILPVFDLGVNRARKIYYTMRRVYGASLQFCLDSVATVVETKLISFPLYIPDRLAYNPRHPSGAPCKRRNEKGIGGASRRNLSVDAEALVSPL